MIDQSGSFLQALRFESCQISLASCRVLKLVHEVLQQAVRDSSPRLAHILYHSARDALELFLAIVPIRFAETIISSPRMAAVFANDCSYIAHNCTLISHMYRTDLGR
jgi:centromere/kinetochore protein ZW10